MCGAVVDQPGGIFEEEGVLNTPTCLHVRVPMALAISTLLEGPKRLSASLNLAISKSTFTVLVISGCSLDTRFVHVAVPGMLAVRLLRKISVKDIEMHPLHLY